MGYLYAALGALIVGAGAYAYYRGRLKSLLRANAVLAKMMAKLEVDLADRRQIERELAHMASFADMAPHPIVEINRDRTIGYVNPAAEQAFPALSQQGIGHPLFEGVVLAAEMLLRDHQTLLMRPIKIDDKIYDQQISLLDGGPRVRLYMSDITALKRLDQLKSDFVNMVSHELRSPLTSIAASVKMIAGGVMGDITPDQQDALQLATINIDRLARMINDLLDVSKIEAGKMELHCARVDLSRLIREVCRSFEPLARERGLEIRSALAPESIKALVDRDKILQVFTNLINNALKFTEVGHVEISAVVEGSQIQCCVSDTGQGIAPDDLPRVFEKFKQCGPAPKGREKGTGLGLSLCKGFIELHGGKIWVESQPSRGSQFIFVLPQLAAADVFKEKALELFGEAVAAGRPLSLVRLTLPSWELVRQKIGEEKVNQLANQIQDFIQSVVRGESDPAFENAGSILLALPAADRAMAAEIVERIQKAWDASLLRQGNGLSAKLDVQIVSYPQDGNLSEKLLSRLQAA